MNDRIDANVPRFNQAMVALLTGIAFVVDVWPLVTIVAIILILSRFAGPRYALFSYLYSRFVKPHLSRESETEPSAPPRFAQLLGAVFLSLASVFFIGGVPLVGWILTLLVTALATLAAATRICVGCLIYVQVQEER